MATDFFERQSLSHRYTKWLVVLFVLAVLGILVATFLATMALLGATGEVQRASHFDGVQRSDGTQRSKVPWQIPLAASGGALALIVGGSLFKIAQLRGGGTVVAERVGGRRIYPNATDLIEQRVLNVVEEMALASGVPVPPVYMLPDEQGINAFAAGYSPSDAVVAVTRGCVEQLTRDQLQGVIAHEFSHILNGDMRLNIRLIGVLNGILLLGLLGRVLLHSAAYSRRGRSKNDGAAAILVIGLAIVILGYLGTLMGGLIKAAVSRQREYLADASAVQFTRNPSGIGGALKRIGAALFGSKVEHPGASEFSHMFFAGGVWEGFSGLMATHPPLPKRILAIDPQWDGHFPKAPAIDAASIAESEMAAGFVGGLSAAENVPVEVVAHATDQVGNPTEIHRSYAAQLVRSLQTSITAAVREPYGARAVIFALLLDRDTSVRQVQMSALTKFSTPDVVELTEKLTPVVDELDVRARLPLVDMALPALRAMSPPQYGSFSKCFHTLVKADDKLGLFEWTLYQILWRHLHPQFEQVKRPFIRYYGLQKLGQPCSVLLSALAHAGSDRDGASASLSDAMRHLPHVPLKLLTKEECGLKQLDPAIKQLAQVSAKQRRRLLDAAAACICADAEVNVREAELLRAVSDMLDCPMPPLLPGQPIRESR